MNMKRAREDWIEHQGGTSAGARESSGWSALWQTKVPSKLRIFAKEWLFAMHESLSTSRVYSEPLQFPVQLSNLSFHERRSSVW